MGNKGVTTEPIFHMSSLSGLDSFSQNHSLTHSFFQQVIIEPTTCQALGQGWDTVVKQPSAC